MTPRHRLPLSALLLVSAAACGPAGNVVVPRPPAFVDSTDPHRTRVTIAKQASAPMVVDWEPEHRADLEVRARRGPAMVRFDEQTFELLEGCEADGAYGYVGVTPKEQHVVLRSRAELQANLPLGAFKLEAALSDKGELDVTMRMVGKQVLDRPTIDRRDLRGKCQGATHYVKALTLGAFRFAAGAAREIEGSVKVGGHGGKGDLAGSTDTLQIDGDFPSCDTADPGASRAPAKCSAILRVEIVPIERAEKTEKDDAAERPRCGEGMRWNGDSCVALARVSTEAKAAAEPEGAASGQAAGKGEVAKGYECDIAQPAECVEQCKLGNLPSCVIVGQYLNAGAAGMPHDEDRARKLWAVACDRGHAPGCTMLATHYQENRKWAEALAFGKTGCLAGDPGACNGVAIQAFFGRGVPEDRKTAFHLWTRACALRDWWSCNNAGVVVLHGMGGLPKDEARARKLFEVACDSPHKAGCVNLASAFEHGEGGPKDAGKALDLYLETCERNDALGCVLAGLMAEEASQKPAVRQKALALYEKACALSEPGGCLSTTEMRQYYGRAYTEDGLDRRACDEGNQPALACYNAAIAHERGYGGRVDLEKADTFLKKACEKGGLKKACRPAAPDTGGGRPTRSASL